MFIRKSIETLLNDKDLKRAAHAELKAACEDALEKLEKDFKTPSSSSSDGNSVLPEPNSGDVSIDAVFLPFELACQSKIPRIVVTALDSIQKLVAYGHIRQHNQQFNDHLTTTVANCFIGPQTDEGVQLQVLKALLTIVTSNNVEVRENSLLLAVRTCYNIFLASRNLINQTTAKATLNQMLSNIFSKMEASAAAAAAASGPLALANNNNYKSNFVNGDLHGDSVEVVYPLVMDIFNNAVSKDSSGEEATKHFTNSLQKDAFLVFRSLCKLSMKPLPEGVVDPKSHELRSKILSLQLLLSILQNGGESFTNSEIFISALKQYLCVALSLNGVSSIAEVFELSLALFISLLTKYRHNLKSQIEIFFKEICLNILEAASSSFDQKWMVIQGISKICEDPQVVVDIFVNYDCDLSAANIFQRLVDDLSKIAQGRQAFDIGASQHQLKRIRIKGLESLVSILKCMVEWSKELYVNPHIQQQEQQEKEKQKQQQQQQQNDEEFIDNPSEFEKVKQHKEILETGIKLFSQKPAKGLKYLMDAGVIQDNTQSIAKFLHQESCRLDKTTLGEFLGDLINKEIMYDYVDNMNFSEMNFVKALRHFLEGFRLPGEAQKIDRLMEKFASRYFQCNPGQDLFANADTAYVLAYSIIMLTTDLHSSQVKKKMTKEEFIRNNRGINDSEDLPENYLSKIYEEIATSEIKMKSDTANVGKIGFVTDKKRRHLIWSMESETISQTAGALMESASSRSDFFTSARHIEHVKPMFKLVWSPVLAAFSVGLQDCDETEISQLCLGGMQCAIRISCIFGFEMERNAFIQALARFTLLTDNSNVTEIKAKNIDAIKTLIYIAHSDGNYLSSSWLDIMKCISQLEFAQMVGTNGLSGGGGSNSGTGGMGGVASVAGTVKNQFLLNAPSVVLQNTSFSDNDQNFRESMTEANSQSVIVAVDRIFTGSKNLNGDAIVDFVTALCAVSKEEMMAQTPRMFSLTKLVEISYYNMERIRLQWSRIWAVLGDHFNAVGCNESQDISFFAVDSLKQLSLKFLEKGELYNFHFQKDFLRPFEFIMKNNKSNQIRDMVVRCISQMVQSQAKNIKSGWKNIFSAFTLSACDDDNGVVSLSFHTTTVIVTAMIEGTNVTVTDFFQDCIKCLSEFACNPLFPDISMESIRLIRKCANFVAEQKHQFLSSTNEEKDRGDRVWIRGWFPILFELSCIMNRSRLDIRTRSLTILFDIVKNYGTMFESHWWLDLFKVLFRIFDVAKFDGDRISHHREWVDTTCNHTLYAMTDVFNEFFTDLSPILLVDLLSQYQWCIQQENDQLSKSAISCLKNLVITNDADIKDDVERTILKFLSDIILCTFAVTPDRQHSSRHYNNSIQKSAKNRILIHLEVISTVKRIVFARLKRPPPTKEITEYYLKITDSFLYSHEVAKDMIQSTEDNTMLPILTKHETHSLISGLEIMFNFYLEDIDPSIEDKLLSVLKATLSHFLSLSSKLQQDDWNNLLLLIFNEMLEARDEKFRTLVPTIYNDMCDILSVHISKELKTVICQNLKKIGTFYGINNNNKV